MKAIGEFVYKGIEKRGAGSFKNDKGEEVNYPESYILKVDEISDGKINERKLKVDPANIGLIDSLKKLSPYDKIKLECDILLYQNSAKVVPVAISNSNNK